MDILKEVFSKVELSKTVQEVANKGFEKLAISEGEARVSKPQANESME